MRVRRRAATVAAIALAVACGGADESRRRLPTEPALRIWNPIVVRWDAGGPRHVDFAIENPTNRTVALAAPDPANARVDVYAGPEPNRVCGVAPAGRASPGAPVAIAPGDRVAVRVDLAAACAAVPPGDYRYVVSYEAGERPGEDAFSGTLPAQYGQLLVAAPPAEAVCAPEVSPEPQAARAQARRRPAARAGERSDRARRPPARGARPEDPR